MSDWQEGPGLPHRREGAGYPQQPQPQPPPYQPPYQPPPSYPQYPQYQYYPTQPWQPAPPQPRRRQFGCGSGCVAIILLLVGGTLIGTIAESLKPANSSPSQVATDTPTPPHIIMGASLGGTKAGFVELYGTPKLVGGKDVLGYHTLGSDLNVAFVLWEYKTGTDHAAHLSTVAVTLIPGEQWEAANEHTICGFLRPDDAQSLGEMPLSSSSTGTVDEFVYQSADLAVTFPAAEFVDHAGHSVTAGTFAINYVPDAARSRDPYAGTGLCQLTLGRY
jgi:hypothetical protein